MRLGVNIDHVATIRETRGTSYPDPIEAALLAESAGADGITCHIRVDRRHIKERDIKILREVVKTHLNVECSLNKEIGAFLKTVKPDWVCIVPERSEEITTEGGLDLMKVSEEVDNATREFKSSGIKVTLFIEPDSKAVELSSKLGADAVELNTGSWCENPTLNKFRKIEEATQVGITLGLEVHAGHGLNLQNVGYIVEIEEISELNIGHSIIARSLMVGIERAVSEMKERILLGV
ncbi:pyridoxine 5'-phosphate synthase [candidate division WOR-3 bacterium]|nr:pyridoxine 5'-phosphate synthase [candidate division WOR-3 bacterium]